MAQYKASDFVEQKDPFEIIKESLTQVVKLETKLIQQNKALQESFSQISKGNTGGSAKELVEITEKLTKANKDLETVQKSKIALEKNELKLLQDLETLKQKEIKTSKDAFDLQVKENKEAERQINISKKLEAQKKKEAQANIVVSDSLAGMRLKLSSLVKEYDNLSKEQRLNTNVGKKLEQQISDINRELKENEAATGRNQRNVGNYKVAIIDALQSLNLYNSTLVEQAETAQLAIGGMSGATKAAKLLKIALASTGIGLAIVGLATLYQYFTKYDEGVEKIERATAAAGAVFNVFFDRTIAGAKALWGIMSGIGNIVAGVAKGLYNIVTFDFTALSENLEQVKEGGKGVKTATLDMVNSFKGAGDAMLKNASDAAKLQGKLQALEDKEREISILRQKQDNELAESRMILNNIEDYTTKQRLDALQKVAKAEKELALKEKAVAAEKYNILRLQMSLENENYTSDQRKNLLAEAYIELLKVQANSDLIIANNLRRQNTLKKELKKTEEEYNATLLKGVGETTKARTDAQIQNDTNAQKDIENLNKYGAKYNEVVDSTSKRGKQQVQDEKERVEQLKAIYQNFTESVANDFAELAKDNELTLKNSLKVIVKALIKEVDAYVSAILYKLAFKAIEQGVLGNIPQLLAIGGGIVAIKTLSKVATNAIEKEQNFADGGLVTGPGTAKSDSVKANLSNGEFVMTANTVAKAPKLIASLHEGKLTDSNAATFVNNQFSDNRIVSKLEENNAILGKLGFAYSLNNITYIQRADGSLEKITT